MRARLFAGRCVPVMHFPKLRREGGKILCLCVEPRLRGLRAFAHLRASPAGSSQGTQGVVLQPLKRKRLSGKACCLKMALGDACSKDTLEMIPD